MEHARSGSAAPERPTRARVVATLGPATDPEGTIARLIDNGVSVFRLNFSHGTFQEHESRLKRVREAARSAARHVAVLGDLQGPKIRVGEVPDGGATLETGQDVLIRTDAEARAHRADDGWVLTCSYEQLADDVAPGHRVLINDGALRLLAVEHLRGDPPDALRCRVIVGGKVTSGKGVNLPDSAVRAPALTDRDRECVEWSVRHGLDFLALSFVRSAAEVSELRRLVSGMCSVEFDVDKTGVGAMIPVIAKIEKPQAVDDIDAILGVADGVMVARGDLGVEMDLARVPMVQKRLIEKANAWGRPCIVATQMLETMITSASPTRAEASDVANAILDGADAVMLSGETAIGAHPVLVVETMRRIVEETELRIDETEHEPRPPERILASRYRTAALAHGAWHVARGVGAKLVVCWSQRGGTARYLSQTGFRVPIIAYSSDEREARRMALLRGVTALHAAVPEDGSLAAWNRLVEDDLRARGWAAPGEPIILVAGCPLGQQGATNTLAIHYMGNPRTGYLQSKPKP